jgi:KUP system potassium uptake protein
VTLVDLAFLIATTHKLPHGGYWSLVLAAFPLVVMAVWIRGQRKLHRVLMPLNWEAFRISYEEVYATIPGIPGTAMFFTRDVDPVPPYIVHCMIACNITYKRNVFVSVVRTDQPWAVESELKPGIATGLDVLEVRAGYLEALDLVAIFREHGITPKVIFYGVEDIETRNLVWRFFSAIKKLSANFMQFNALPSNRVQGVVTRVNM